MTRKSVNKTWGFCTTVKTKLKWERFSYLMTCRMSVLPGIYQPISGQIWRIRSFGWGSRSKIVGSDRNDSCRFCESGKRGHDKQSLAKHIHNCCSSWFPKLHLGHYAQRAGHEVWVSVHFLPVSGLDQQEKFEKHHIRHVSCFPIFFICLRAWEGWSVRHKWEASLSRFSWRVSIRMCFYCV